MYTIVKRKSKYVAYDDKGYVIIISHNPRIVKHQAEIAMSKRVNNPIDD